MARLRDNLARLGLEAETVVADAAEWPGGNDGGFDGILVDAPCTSTGTIRRHPDVAWLRQEADIAALTSLAEAPAAEGRQPAEARRDAGLLHLLAGAGRGRSRPSRRFLPPNSRVRRVPIEAGEVAGLAEILTADGDLRTLPCHLPHVDPRLGGLDGFYAARLVKS